MHAVEAAGGGNQFVGAVFQGGNRQPGPCPGDQLGEFRGFAGPEQRHRRLQLRIHGGDVVEVAGVPGHSPQARFHVLHPAAYRALPEYLDRHLRRAVVADIHERAVEQCDNPVPVAAELVSVLVKKHHHHVALGLGHLIVGCSEDGFERVIGEEIARQEIHLLTRGAADVQIRLFLLDARCPGRDLVQCRRLVRRGFVGRCGFRGLIRGCSALGLPPCRALLGNLRGASLLCFAGRLLFRRQRRTEFRVRDPRLHRAFDQIRPGVIPRQHRHHRNQRIVIHVKSGQLARPRIQNADLCPWISDRRSVANHPRTGLQGKRPARGIVFPRDLVGTLGIAEKLSAGVRGRILNLPREPALRVGL